MTTIEELHCPDPTAQYEHVKVGLNGRENSAIETRFFEIKPSTLTWRNPSSQTWVYRRASYLAGASGQDLCFLSLFKFRPCMIGLDRAWIREGYDLVSSTWWVWHPLRA